MKADDPAGRSGRPGRALFVGDFRHSVDRKGRTAVPAAFLKVLALAPGEPLVLASGRNRTIECHPPDEWNEHVETMVSRSESGDPFGRQLLRTVLSRCYQVEPDRRGRILIPEYLRRLAEIKTRVTFVGAGEYFEMWSPERYDAFVERACESLGRYIDVAGDP